MNKLYNNRGYTLLFASLTAALVLGVAVFILSVSRRQYLLSANARNSMYSIYAADSGIECAVIRNADLNADEGGIEISSSTLVTNFTMKCAGQVVAMTPVESPVDTADFFLVSSQESKDDFKQAHGFFNTGGQTCAELIISTGRYGDGDIASLEFAKVFDSKGYNLCKDTGGVWKPDTTSAGLVERALRLTYKGVW